MGVFIAYDDNESFDDGLDFIPGEEGFTMDIAKAHYGDRGFYYSGTPNWQPHYPPEDPAEPDPDAPEAPSEPDPSDKSE